MRGHCLPTILRAQKGQRYVFVDGTSLHVLGSHTVAKDHRKDW